MARNTQNPPEGEQEQQGEQETPARRPGRQPGQEAKVYDFSALSLELLSNPQSTDRTLDSLTAPMRARNEQQAAMDAVVALSYEDWKTGVLRNDKMEVTGSTDPATGVWSHMGGKRRYHIPPEHVEALKVLVRRAASFYRYGIKWGNPARDVAGNEIVVFVVRDVARGSKDDTVEDTSDSETPTDETPTEETSGDAQEPASDTREHVGSGDAA